MSSKPAPILMIKLSLFYFRLLYLDVSPRLYYTLTNLIVLCQHQWGATLPKEIYCSCETDIVRISLNTNNCSHYGASYHNSFKSQFIISIIQKKLFSPGKFYFDDVIAGSARKCHFQGAKKCTFFQWFAKYLRRINVIFIAAVNGGNSGARNH